MKKMIAKVIVDLTTYYGLAIRRNAHDMVKIKTAAYATYFHKSLLDENP